MSDIKCKHNAAHLLKIAFKIYASIYNSKLLCKQWVNIKCVNPLKLSIAAIWISKLNLKKSFCTNSWNIKCHCEFSLYQLIATAHAPNFKKISQVLSSPQSSYFLYSMARSYFHRGSGFFPIGTHKLLRYWTLV